MNSIERYVMTAPLAVSGSNGHGVTLGVGRTLYNGFGLSREETLKWLQVYNTRLAEKWTERELEHKTDSAVRGSYDKPRGWMLGKNRGPVCEKVRGLVRPAKRHPIMVGCGERYVPARLQATLSGEQLREANRIAGELKQLHRAGLIPGPDSPWTILIAGALGLFKGTLVLPPATTPENQISYYEQTLI
jgi:hypothetical protein